jgi:nucleoside-diphosphate-sugar epimerase
LGSSEGRAVAEAGEVVVTGGAGFIGVALSRRLLAEDPGLRLVITDVVRHPRVKNLGDRARFVEADLSDAAACRELITPRVSTVFHFASLVSGGAEADFEANMKANVYATVNLLEACRRAGGRPRLVFTSSIATFGGQALPEEVDDWTHQHPQNSYGVAKAVGEQLLNDYSRKGYVDGRGVRLPAIVVRDEPNTAASGYASSIIREPLHGRDYACPVSPQTRIPILSIGRCVELLARLAELPAGTLGDYRTINGPSLSPSAGEMAAAVEAVPEAPKGRISFTPDERIQSMISAWPRRLRAERAARLGLRADDSIGQLVADYAAGLRQGAKATA